MADSYFQSKIKEYLSEKNISQVQLVEQLKTLDKKVLSGLDVNTFSRWIKGKSTPSLFKMLYILSSLEFDLVDFILNSTVLITKKEESIFSKYFDSVNVRIKNIGYIAISDRQVSTDTLTKHELRKEYDSYYQNNSAYMRIRSQHDESLSDNESNYLLTVIKVSMNDKKIGHIAFKNNNGNLLTHIIDLDSKHDRGVSVLPVYYLDSETMKILLSEFLYYLLTNGMSYKNRNILFFISQPNTAKLFEDVFESRLVYYLRKENKSNEFDKGLYLYEVDFFKMLSSTYIFNLVKNTPPQEYQSDIDRF